MSGRRLLARRAVVRAAFAASIGSFVALPASTARADATTGLWPNISVPPAPPEGEAQGASKDAALIVGIERYDALPKIPGAAENARDWEKYFLFGRRVPPERVRLLTDQNATVEAIKARAEEMTAAVPEGGTLFVIFIGHGAPAEAGQKGLLLGADVRPSDASFASRSLSYDQLATLTNAGKQGRTVMVLDACFSGVSNEGKALLPSVQPVVATTLIASQHTTVFSAGTAGEYAGALPGSQRPALSYLLLGALRGWADSDGDGRVTPAEAHAYMGTVLRSLPNNHEQHPQLNTDAESEPLASTGREKGPDLPTIRSKVDTWKPPVEAAPQEPRLRVAVGCGDTEPKGTDDGLAVYIDDSPTVAPAVGGEKRWDEALRRNVVEHIAFPIAPGAHRVVIRLPNCEPAEVDVQVADGSTVDVDGVLRPDTAFLLRGPAGMPNWGRLGVGLWRLSVVDADYGDADLPTYENARYRPTVTGVMLQPAVTFRWWTLGLDLGYAIGKTTLTGPIPAETASSYSNRPTSWLRAGLRGGARFPFHYAAMMLGVGAGYDNVVVDVKDRLSEPHNAYGSAWSTLDIQPFCDWSFAAGINVDALLPQAATNKAVVGLGLSVGIAYQPNHACTVERSAKYKVEAETREAAKR